MFHRNWLRLSIAVLVFFIGASELAVHAQAILRNKDIALSGFGQFTSDVSGNGISLRATKSVGAQGAFRHTYHWWLGYEAAYAYTRFSENYSGRPFSYQHNMHEFSGSYLVQGPKVLGFQPFATVGVSALIFSPSLNGGQNVSWQGKPALNYGLGVNYDLLTSHLGVRAQYRGLYYKAPDFGQAILNVNSFRETSEPMVGVYARF